MEFYRWHWLEISPERLRDYDSLFQWRPQMAMLLDGFPIEEGQRLLDYGCGPGWTTLELARRVGPSGRVIGCDLNRDFLSLAQQHAAELGLTERLEWLQAGDSSLPLADASLDRIFCKNVLEYVPSLDDTLREFRRLLRPGGVARLIDSDWGLVVLEPLGPERLERLLAHARHAFKDGHAGRHLYGAARRAGFAQVKVRVIAYTDTEGQMRSVVRNLVDYALAGGLPQAEARRLLQEVDAALERQEYLLALPQFIVTATAP